MAKKSKPPANLLTATQVAAILGVEARTVRHHCVRGAFPGAVIMGKTWIIPATAVEAFQANPPKVGAPPGKRSAKQAKSCRKPAKSCPGKNL